jgi:DNA polymerase III epsilon subunit-like protein
MATLEITHTSPSSPLVEDPPIHDCQPPPQLVLWIVLDLESTGLNLARDRITQIAAAAYLAGAAPGKHPTALSAGPAPASAACRGRFSCLVRPGVPVGPGATRVSGLTTAALAGQPGFPAQGIRLLAWLAAVRSGCPKARPVLVAHNGLRCAERAKGGEEGE